MKVDFEMHLETVLSLDGTEEEILTQLDHIKENWFVFVKENKDNLIVTFYSEGLED